MVGRWWQFFVGQAVVLLKGTLHSKLAPNFLADLKVCIFKKFLQCHDACQIPQRHRRNVSPVLLILIL